MGKRILAQRKGRGVLGFRSPSHRHIGEVKYRSFKKDEKLLKFKVLDLIHSPGRGAPVAKFNMMIVLKDFGSPLKEFM